MSSRGRDVVAHVRHGEDAIERLGGLLPWEAERIRRGNYASIVRRLEPAFTVGQRCVVATAYHRPQLIRESPAPGIRPVPTGEVIPARRVPSLTIEIAGLRRTAKGLWSVGFHVDDRRDPVRRIRRVPPPLTLTTGDADAYDHDPTAEEEYQARIESAYGGSSKGSVDDQEGVPVEVTEQYATEAAAVEIVVAAAHDHKAAEERRKQKSLEQDLADALRAAEQKGIDTTSVRFITERQIARLRRRLDKVA